MTARRARLRVVVYFLTIALIGIWMTSACLADDATGAGPGSTSSANPDGSRPPAGEDTAGASKNSDAIDTRITVHSERPSRRDAAKEGDRKVDPFARPFFRPRRSAQESAGRVTRDAIGLPAIRRDGMKQESGQRHNVPVVHEPAATPKGFGANTSDLARTGGVLGRQPSNANPVVRPTALDRGTINGTNLTRRSVGPSHIGGPAKPVAGISGTTIRPKH